MICACDFDGTIVTHRFPNIGMEIPGAIKTIQTLRENGHRVFLWTMRGYHSKYKHCLDDAVMWLEEHDCPLDGINRSPGGFTTTSPKQHANLYIDDSALGCPMQIIADAIGPTTCVDWSGVIKHLHNQEYITTEQYNEINEHIERTYKEQGIPHRPHPIYTV